MNTQQKTKGFTIIEVVLVLAIAGLIFLMVFLALPALQRTQRDTQRRDDLARIASSITTAKSNNNGRLPWTETAPANAVIVPGEFNAAGNYADDDTPADGTADGDSFVGQYLINGGSSYNDPSTIALYALNTAADNTVSATNQIKIYSTNGTDCTTSTPVAGGTTWVAAMFQENGGRICQNL